MKKITLTLFMFITLCHNIYAKELNTNRWHTIQNTVVDKQLNIMWQDTRDVIMVDTTWSMAKKYCNNLTFNNHTNWRLPKYSELLTIVDYTKSDPAIINNFKHVDTESNYWSNTVHLSKSGMWIVYFYNGSSYYDELDTKNTTRCVRDIS
jgi:hypothetical protein